MIHRDSEQNYACEFCFQDPYVLKKIHKIGVSSNCGWCGGTNVKVLPLHVFGEPFREVVSIYEEVDGVYEDGDEIAHLLQQDWEIFSDRISESFKLLRELTQAILKAGLHPKDDVDLPDFDGYFRSPSNWLDKDWDRKVESFLSGSDNNKNEDDSMCSVLNALPDKENALKIALEDLADSYNGGEIFYRARIHKDRLRNERFTPNELGAPSPQDAKVGRGNRKGKPVLYLARERETAIAEVRPWRHAAVAVGEHILCKPIQIVNLLKYDFPDSPFSSEYLAWRLQLNALFHRLAEELSRPVMPSEEEILYKPSQHFCEFLKEEGFDGVSYPSGIEEGGSNIILFDPSNKTRVKNVTYVRITKIVNKFELVDEGGNLYDQFLYDHMLDQEKKNDMP